MKRVAKGCNILSWVTRKNFLHHFFFILKDKDLYHKSLLSKKKQAIENTVCNIKNVTSVLLIYFFLLSNSSHLFDFIYSKIQSAWSLLLDLFAISDVDNCYSISFQVSCPIFLISFCINLSNWVSIQLSQHPCVLPPLQSPASSVSSILMME